MADHEAIGKIPTLAGMVPTMYPKILRSPVFSRNCRFPKLRLIAYHRKLCCILHQWTSLLFERFERNIDVLGN
jgi:hypothetical protein